MNSFVNAMQKEENNTFTENGAFATKTTDSALLDLFATIGALRRRDNQAVENLFSKAFEEDNLLATKLLFYARDIRGGLGEREVSRILFKYLATTKPYALYKNIKLIPEFGRWDDLYCLVGTTLESHMWDEIRYQFRVDLAGMREGEPISLLAKWLKSVNTSSKESRMLGRLTAKQLGMTEVAYRKILSEMRAYIDVVERKMASQNWETINYASVPSYAMKNYRNAFERNDTARFSDYIQQVSAGEEKINASTLFPYDIMDAYGLATGWSDNLLFNKQFDTVLEEQWKALPNYIDGENNVLIMADTSGSMKGRPLNTAVGLAIYFAERNKGPFKNTFMTFSSKPSFVTLKGESLYDRVRSVPNIISNTNLEAAFDRILKVAKENNVPKEDMPKALVVISDMEFDSATTSNDQLFYDLMKSRYEEYGFTIPKIVFWNVDSRQDVFHVKSSYPGVQLVSGQSVSTFKNVLNSIINTPYESMLEVLNSERYNCITLK